VLLNTCAIRKSQEERNEKIEWKGKKQEERDRKKIGNE
jgi:hypothetical protein